MPKFYAQHCLYFNKINHTYFFLDAVRRKDYLHICRHFLWIMNRFNNRALTQKSIVATIVELTKYANIDSRTITKVLVEMKNNGEIERFKNVHNQIGLNPVLTNRERWSRFKSDYAGLEPKALTAEEISCRLQLEKLVKMPISSFRDESDFRHTENLREEETEMKAALEKIGSLEATVGEMKSMITDMLNLLKKHEPEEAAKVERHLKLVKNEADS